jgi:shikimate dehydrogenase
VSRADGPVLALRPDGDGWLRGGEVWEPPGPFYAVLGDPVAHSLSPALQGAALRATGLAYAYHAVRASRVDLARIFQDRGGLGLRGFNVTIPHKLAAAAACASLTETARQVGAVNTVRLTDAGWVGHNTDVGGLHEVLVDLLVGRPAGRGLVLGAGGAARAAVLALLDAGADSVRVAARRGPGREALTDWLAAGAPPGRDIGLLDWGAPPDAAWSAAGWVCVSCVPGDADLSFLAPVADALPPVLWLDMNYGDRTVAAPGVPAGRVHDGLPVLLAQGALSFSWWFDRDAPRDVMAAAIAGG